MSLPLFKDKETEPEKLSDLIKVTCGAPVHIFENNFQKHKQQELWKCATIQFLKEIRPGNEIVSTSPT